MKMSELEKKKKKRRNINGIYPKNGTTSKQPAH